jgi:hypothetical protein
MMIWHLTKSDHNLSISPWVRNWLRAGRVRRSVTTLAVLAVLGLIWLAMQMMISLSSVNAVVMLRQASTRNYRTISEWAVAGMWIFVLFTTLERLVDWWATRSELARMMSSPDVILATRGEYIGGHPMLPHGRFVYLTLSGTLQSPQLNIVLPPPYGKAAEVFSMPVLDVERTKERIGDPEEELVTTVMLASTRFETQYIGQRSFLNVEYIGDAGRRYQVEFGHFLFGDVEVQNWRNYILCIQAQAETGQKPYGPWKTLPAEKQVASAGSAVVH